MVEGCCKWWSRCQKDDQGTQDEASYCWGLAYFTASVYNVIPFTALTLLVGGREGHAAQPVKKLVCWWWSSLFTICGDACSFMCECWGLHHRLAQCMSPQGWGKLVNAALLSLINEACVNVCCATLLSSELVGPAYMQARSSNLRGRECRPSGKPRAGSGVVRINPLCFLAGCRTRRLNQV